MSKNQNTRFIIYSSFQNSPELKETKDSTQSTTNVTEDITMNEDWDVQICCMGAGYVGGPTMAVIAKMCPKVRMK